MLSFEMRKQRPGEAADELEVYLDNAGLDSLLAQLNFLKEKRTDHVHLMTESWGGTHLDDRPQDPENTTIHHVKFVVRG